MWLFGFDAVPQALRGEFARSIARQVERFGDWWSQERIAECVEH